MGLIRCTGKVRVSTVSCGAADSCSAGGYFTGALGHKQAFVVSSYANGVWGKAEEVHGPGAPGPNAA